MPRGAVLGHRGDLAAGGSGLQHEASAWVGLIALMGVDAETAVFMLLYLDLSYDEAKREGRLRSLVDLQQAVLHGGQAIRPEVHDGGNDVRGTRAHHGRQAPART